MDAAKPCMAHPNKPTMLPPPAKKLINGLCKILLFFFGFLLGVLTNANLQSLHYPLTPWLPAPIPPSPPPRSAPAPPPPSPSPPPPPSAPPESGERLGLSGFLAPSGLMHDMTDEELLSRASMAPRDRSTPYRRVPKVAFLFLARGDLPLRPLWERFFAGHQGLYSIYVHTDPAYTDTPPKESVFYGRRIPSQKTAWGKPILVKAERRLLANALLDFSNEWFALLSDSCVPLFAFPTVYAYVANSTTSFVDCFDDEPGRSRYDPFFADHNLTLSQWRKGSQFFEMDRPLAIEVVSEETYFPVFDIFCTNHSRRTCMMDEHYIPTMVHMWGWERNANRTLTFVEWRGGAHPVRYGKGDVTEGLLKGMRGSDPANCSYNGGLTDVCFLFARKFGADALELLLDLAPKVLGFG